MATGYIMLDTPNTVQPQGGWPRRGGFRPSGTAIVHTSEGDWRAGVAALTRLVQTRADYGCYHRGCDWEDIALYYPWEWETWQDTETNNWAVGIAAACKTSDWGNMPADVEDGFYRNMGRMAADFVIYMRDTYKITVPLRRISGAEARARVPGFCAHGDSGIARSDPGANFNWARFFDYTRQALAGQLTIPEGFLMALTEQQQKDIYWVLCTDEGRAHFGSHIGKAVLNYAVPWYGSDGKIPETGRQQVTLSAVAGWIDVMFNNTNRQVAAVKDLVANHPAAELKLDAAAVAELATQLKQTLAPALASELARRLQD